MFKLCLILVYWCTKIKYFNIRTFTLLLDLTGFWTCTKSSLNVWSLYSKFEFGFEDSSPFRSVDGPISFIRSSCRVLDILFDPVPVMARLAELRCGWFLIRSPPAEERFLVKINICYACIVRNVLFSILWAYVSNQNFYYRVVLIIVSSRPNMSNERSLKNGCCVDIILFELIRPGIFMGGWGLLPGVNKALSDDGVTDPLPGYCLPPEIVVLLDVLLLLLLRLRGECAADEIIALPR